MKSAIHSRHLGGQLNCLEPPFSPVAANRTQGRICDVPNLVSGKNWCSVSGTARFYFLLLPLSAQLHVVLLQGQSFYPGSISSERL